VEHPVAQALLEAGWVIHAPDLRATGEQQPAGDAIGNAPDHNSAEHALWVGMPLLGQWVVDVRAVVAYLAERPGLQLRRLAIIGLGQAGIVAACAIGGAVASLALIDTPASLVTMTAYPRGTRMGLLAPGLLKAGDVPHLAALAAPGKLIVAGGSGADGKALEQKPLEAAYAFTRRVYGLMKASDNLVVKAPMKPAEVVAKL
jgi:hypothetical protein